MAHGIIERIGEDISLAKLVIGERELRHDNPIADHDAALRATFDCSPRQAPIWARRVWRPTGTGWCTAGRSSTGPRWLTTR